MRDVPDTGERILLDAETPLMIARHFSAYKFAEDYVSGKNVLDIGCGEGYGTHYLSGFAESITGIDYDKTIVEYAKEKYRRNNLKFYTLDIKNIDSLDSRFEAVCSFQVIEHIQDAGLFLENIKRLLTDDGVFICSTPNRRDASLDSPTPLNKFHLKEYLLDEYRQLLENYFKSADIFGLRRGKKLNFYRRLKKIGVFNFLPQNLDPVKRFYRQINYADFYIASNNLGTALDFIAVCRK